MRGKDEFTLMTEKAGPTEADPSPGLRVLLVGMLVDIFLVVVKIGAGIAATLNEIAHVAVVHDLRDGDVVSRANRWAGVH